MDRLPVSPIVGRVIEVIEKKLGFEQAARRLDIAESLLEAWRDGKAAVPRAEFMRLVDLLLELDVSWDDWDQT